MKLNTLKNICLLSLAILPILLVSAKTKTKSQELTDREYWAKSCYTMAKPVLSAMSKGELQKTMLVEVSPIWDNRNKKVAYMEAFGRLMAGIAPWLALPDDETPEGVQRKQLREWALKSYSNAVDPESPDYLLWDTEGQALVDGAFIANSFLRASKQLWEPLDSITKQRYIQKFKGFRRVNPPYTNWLLFSGMVETFLLLVDEQYDSFRIDMALKKINEWYVGDGWYSDGPDFAFDYYNSYVIQPMTFDILQELQKHRTSIGNGLKLDVVKTRMQRYGEILERLISPEGTFPAFGRSMTYRMGVFQPLVLLSWRCILPESLPEGQVRNGLTTSMKRMFSVEGNYNKEGFLQLGLAGHQPEVADRYTNTGSLYLSSLVFLPLGLPADHSFWTAPAQDWTSKKAWNGKAFPRDHALSK
jgi:hypothetical protein